MRARVGVRVRVLAAARLVGRLLLVGVVGWLLVDVLPVAGGGPA